MLFHKTTMAEQSTSAADADNMVKEAIKKLAAASRVAAAAIQNEKQAKASLKIAQKVAKTSHKKEQSKDKKPKTPFQTAYKLFGDDLRKTGEKVSVQRQGELWKSADQAYWILKVKEMNDNAVRQII